MRANIFLYFFKGTESSLYTYRMLRGALADGAKIGVANGLIILGDEDATKAKGIKICKACPGFDAIQGEIIEPGMWYGIDKESHELIVKPMER